MIKNLYRVETGKLYVYSRERNAYVFVLSMNGRTKRQAIRDYQESLTLSDCY